MRVTAYLRAHPGHRGLRQVVSHQPGRPAQERERCSRHPPGPVSARAPAPGRGWTPPRPAPRPAAPPRRPARRATGRGTRSLQGPCRAPWARRCRPPRTPRTAAARVPVPPESVRHRPRHLVQGAARTLSRHGSPHPVVHEPPGPYWAVHPPAVVEPRRYLPPLLPSPPVDNHRESLWPTVVGGTRPRPTGLRAPTGTDGCRRVPTGADERRCPGRLVADDAAGHRGSGRHRTGQQEKQNGRHLLMPPDSA